MISKYYEVQDLYQLKIDNENCKILKFIKNILAKKKVNY